MLSKWMPWDFVKNNPQTILPDLSGLYGFMFSDRYIEKLCLARIPDSFWNNKKVLNGKDLTLDWCAQNLETIGLFFQDESYLVLDAQEMPVDVLNFFKSLNQNFSKNIVLSFFEARKSWNEVSSGEIGQFYEITPPKFWEYTKLLEFLATQFHMSLSYGACDYIVNAVNNTSGDFIGVLKQLHLAFPAGQAISEDMAKREIERSRVDHFEIAKLFGQKKVKEGFRELLSAVQEGELSVSTLTFLYKHFLKIYDPSYMKSNKRVSKYDKEILSYSKLWDRGEVKEMIGIFQRLLLDHRKGREALIETLRLEVLQCY